MTILDKDALQAAETRLALCAASSGSKGIELMRDMTRAAITAYLSALTAATPPSEEALGFTFDRKSTIIGWFRDRFNNTIRLAEHKVGDDKEGWLEDAAYYRDAIEIMSATTPPTATPSAVSDEVRKLREALKPFASYAGVCSSQDDDDLRINLEHPVYERRGYLSVGDFRRAREALSPPRAKASAPEREGE